MNYKTEKLNAIYSIILLTLSIYLVYYVFFSQYKKGYEQGMFSPPGEKKAASQEINMRAMAVPNDQVIAKGSDLFQANCAPCHGPTGKGDGPRGERLNPKPRNYSQKEKFIKGTTVLDLFKTVTNGVPGSSMPSFDLLPVDERFAIVHFIRTLIPNPDNDSPEAIAALPGSGEAPSVQEATSTASVRIPISLAIEKLLKETKEKKKMP